jgi:hypothetical protein
MGKCRVLYGIPLLFHCLKMDESNEGRGMMEKLKCIVCGLWVKPQAFDQHVRNHALLNACGNEVIRDVPWCVPTPTEDLQVEQIYPGRVFVPFNEEKIRKASPFEHDDFEDVFQNEMEEFRKDPPERISASEAKQILADSSQRMQSILSKHLLNYSFNFDHIFDPPEKPPLTMADLRRDCFPKEYQWYQEQPESVEVEEHPAKDWRGRLESIKEHLKGGE